MVKYTACIQLVTVAVLIKYIIEPQLRGKEANNWTVFAFQIDNGSEANCLRLKDFTKTENRLKTARAVLKAYSGYRILPNG